jgi:hypothetical protein
MFSEHCLMNRLHARAGLRTRFPAASGDRARRPQLWLAEVRRALRESNPFRAELFDRLRMSSCARLSQLGRINWGVPPYQAVWHTDFRSHTGCGK